MLKKRYTFNLPKSHFSYSAYTLWLKDKNAFRRKYYENEKPFETVETIFGKKIATELQELKKIEGLVVYPEPEHKIEVDFRGLKLLGYIDSFWLDRYKFREYKTGHKSADGKVPWDIVKVKKHVQLVWYSLLIELRYGLVDNECHLDWLETAFRKKTKDFDGHELETESRELYLTGQIKTFKRKIFKWEREKLKREIIKVALEISQDYETYQRNTKQSNVGAGKALA